MKNPAIVTSSEWDIIEQHWKKCEAMMYNPEGDFDQEMIRSVSLINLLPNVRTMFCCSSHPEDLDDPAYNLTIMVACRDQEGVDTVTEIFSLLCDPTEGQNLDESVKLGYRRTTWELAMVHKRLPGASFKYYHPLVIRCRCIESNAIRDVIIRRLETVLFNITLGSPLASL